MIETAIKLGSLVAAQYYASELKKNWVIGPPDTIEVREDSLSDGAEMVIISRKPLGTDTLTVLTRIGFHYTIKEC